MAVRARHARRVEDTEDFGQRGSYVVGYKTRLARMRKLKEITEVKGLHTFSHGEKE